VGTWAVIEQIKPHQVKDIEEQVRIYYEVGLGRDFSASEIAGEKNSGDEGTSRQSWRAKPAQFSCVFTKC